MLQVLSAFCSNDLTQQLLTYLRLFKDNQEAESEFNGGARREVYEHNKRGWRTLSRLQFTLLPLIRTSQYTDNADITSYTLHYHYQSIRHIGVKALLECCPQISSIVD